MSTELQTKGECLRSRLRQGDASSLSAILQSLVTDRTLGACELFQRGINCQAWQLVTSLVLVHFTLLTVNTNAEPFPHRMLSQRSSGWAFCLRMCLHATKQHIDEISNSVFAMVSYIYCRIGVHYLRFTVCHSRVVAIFDCIVNALEEQAARSADCCLNA